ncbi:MAG: histidine phosphatase family protein, partial [Paludibacteraceae bacterium]|nr:histidine phosphatase family protein [Paludibacteraceae bacterium]
SADTLRWNDKLSEESDPIYSASVASHITSADTLSWNEKLSEESDPIYSSSVASHITSADTLSWNEKLSEESDPIYSASVASHITSADTLRWNEKLSEERDPIYSASVASHITSADTLRWNEKLSAESDPIYSASVASHITSADTLRWNEKLSEESDPIYSASVASHITSADTLRWNEKLSEESDPIYSASVASQITSEDTMSWNRKLEISDLKDYAHKGELPIVPTKVSEFENDATYVTQADLSMLAEVVRELTQRVNDLEADNQQINRVVDSLKLETQKLQYKVDSMQAVSNDAIVNYAKTVTPVYSFPLDSWTYAYEVYESLKEGDRVVFVVRHSERDEGCSGSECDLNANGINMVKEIGVKFRGGLAGIDDSYYGSSDAERCKTTSYLIATTRGDTHLSSNQDVVNPIEVLKSKYYGEDLNSWPGRAEYYNKNPEEVAQKSKVLVNDLLNRTKGKTFSWFTSHDYVMVPLVEWATNLGIDYEKYRGIYNGEDSDNQDKETDYFYWNNFLSGVAILVHKDNTFEIYPVKNLEDGFRYNRCYKDW